MDNVGYRIQIECNNCIIHLKITFQCDNKFFKNYRIYNEFFSKILSKKLVKLVDNLFFSKNIVLKNGKISDKEKLLYDLWNLTLLSRIQLGEHRVVAEQKYGGDEEAIQGEPTDMTKTEPKKNINRANELGLFL